MGHNPNDDYVVDMKSGTVTNAVQALTDFGFSQGNINKAHSLLITSNANSLVFTAVAAGVPAIGNGHIIAAGALIAVEGVDLVRNFAMIRGASSDATITISLIGNKPQVGTINRS